MSRSVALVGGQVVVGYEAIELLEKTLVVDGSGRVAEYLEPGVEPPIGADVIDVSGCLVLPGFVCAHTHLYSALSRGMPGPAKAPTDFRETLGRVWWRLDQAFDAASLAASGRIGLAEALLCGTTTVVDHHESPGFIAGSLDVLADAARAVGVRAVLSYGVTDRHGMGQAIAGIGENRRFAGAAQGEPLLRAMVGMHAAFTAGGMLPRMVADACEALGVGVHVHVAEDAIDADAVDRLDAVGLVNENSLFVHGVHATPKQLARCEQAGVTWTHQPRSNMNNRVGWAALPGASRVALGTDGIGADMLAEAQAAFFVARDRAERSAGGGAGFGAERAWAQLAQGRRLAARQFGVSLDNTVGAAADLVVLERPTPTDVTAGSLPWQLVFGFSRAHVRDVLVAGRPVVRDRALQTRSFGALQDEAREQARALWARMETIQSM